MRLGLSFAITGILSAFAFSQAPQTPAVTLYTFPPDELAKALSFWAQAGRYTVSTPDDFREKGLWQVRLSVAGSTWIWNYNKARRASAPPTQDAQAVNPQQQVWDQWIQSKVDRDRWEAYQVALQANNQVLGMALPKADKNIPVSEPPRPAPIPSDLLALAGPPPKFAEAVVPMQHRVSFDDDTLTYFDKVRLGNPKYAYYRFSSGVMDEGKAVKSLPVERVRSLLTLAGLDESTARIMMSVSMLEGGFDSINTYDTGYVSVGFIQFACLREGGGALGGLLAQYKLDKPDKFEADFQRFGIDVSPDGKFDVVDPDTGAEYHGPDAALKVVDDKRLIAVFQRAGQMSDDFVAEQIRAAKTMFYPGDDTVTFTLNSLPVTAKVSDVIKSEAGLATLMDRKVNTGSLGQFGAILSAVADQAHAATLDDIAKFESAIVTVMKYRQNYLVDPTLSQPQPAPFELHLPTPGGKR
jgi:hypothetical protein